MADDDENPEMEAQIEVNVDDINLREPLEIEQAVMEYMLAFEAYQSARRSKNPEIRGKMVQYMKQYREAYARFLIMMREDKLYEPQKPKNPAGRYNRKHLKQKGHKRQWRNTAAQNTREKVKKMVEAGVSPELIKEEIKASLPVVPMSIDPIDVFSTGLPAAGITGSAGGSAIGKDIDRNDGNTNYDSDNKDDNKGDDDNDRPYSRPSHHPGHLKR
jgi:hypothetical protein